MAGAGYKLFNTGDVLTAAQVNTYLQEQTVMVFANSTARTTALSGVLAEGMVSYLQDTNAVEVYNGSAWVGVSGAGDVTEVQAGTGISVASGTGPIPVVTNTMATEITAKGDLIVGTGSGTFDNLPAGTNGYTLVADSSVSPTGLKWAAPAASGFVGCKIDRSTDLAIANNTEVLVTFNAEDFDTDSFHSTSTNTSRITIPSGKGGKYLFTAQFFMSITDGASFIVLTHKNGSVVNRTQSRPGSGGVISVVTSDIYDLVATDYIQYIVFQNTGVSQDLKAADSTATVTYAAAQFLGA